VANAILLSGNSGATSGSNTGATRESADPSFGSDTSVWWRWTAPSNGTAVFDTVGSSFDTILAVYAGSVSTSTLVDSDDDSGEGVASLVSFAAVGARTYYIGVLGFGSAVGDIQLNWNFTGAPSNDNFSNAISLAGNSGTTSGSNVAATSETGEPTFGNSRSVWWRWTAPSSGTTVVDTVGSNFDTELAIYTGTSVSALTLVVRDSDSGGANYTSRALFTAVGGTAYYIAITGYSTTAGSIQLHWEFTGGPSNDDFSNAITLSGNSGVTTGSNFAATSETGEPTFGNSRSVWWRWTAPAEGTAAFDTSGSGFDTELAVYTGSAVNALTLVGGNDDSGGELTSRVSFAAVAARTYYIAVTGFGDTAGSIRLNWQFTASGTPQPTTFTWQSWRQREGENNNIPVRGANNWSTSGASLSFSETGNQRYIEDFVETAETFVVEGIRIEWDMRASVATHLGYVGPYVLLVQESGTGWNSPSIGAQVFYRWEGGGANGAVLHAGRLGNPVIASHPAVPGINESSFARHVVTVSNGVVTWTANGQVLSSADMGTTPYSPMRLIVGARLYDSGVAQTIEIRNLTVTSAGGPGGPISFSLDGDGLFTSMATSSGNNVQSGYGRIAPNTDHNPSGMAIFGYRQGGVLVSEAAVPVSKSMLGGLFYAEQNARVQTGIAIANAHSQPATVSFVLRDALSGNAIVRQGTATIPANGQIAAFLTQAPFLGPSSMVGTFSFTSSVPVGVVALRGLTNERSEFLVTTTPVTDLSAHPVFGNVEIAHFADGGGWTTQLVLFNPSDNVMSGSFRLTDSSGAPAVTSVTGPFATGLQPNSAFTYRIEARQGMYLQTSGPAALQSGRISITPESNQAAPSAFVIFSLRQNGITVTEASVAAMAPDMRFRLYAETGPAMQTGLALSAGASGATVNLLLTSADGTPSGYSGTVTIPANGHVANFLDQIPGFTGLPASFRGILMAWSTAPFSVAGLRGRYNERNDFLITTTAPVSELAHDTGGEAMFPHLAAGGGYSTQLVFFSDGPDCNGTLRLVSQSGGALDVVVTPLGQ
jgi:hypothetical protein